MQNLEIKYLDFSMLKGFELGGDRLFELAESAKFYIDSDVESCVIKLRKFVECFVDSVYSKYQINKKDLNLYGKISNKPFSKKLSQFIRNFPTQANSTPPPPHITIIPQHIFLKQSRH